MLIDYNELEDYEGKELTIIARLESRKYYRDKPLPVFDYISIKNKNCLLP